MDRSKVEGIYRTTHLQQGMLFHTLYAPSSGVYVTQLSGFIDGLDVDAFRAAWQHVIDETMILRTAFVWKRIENAQQVVLRPGVVELPLEFRDWTELEPAEQKRQREEYAVADRARGFDVSKAPLMRLALFRVAKDTHWLLWTVHHLLIDGWSRQCLLEDVFDAYGRLMYGGDPISSNRPAFTNYVAWMHKQSLDTAEEAWRNALRGYGGHEGFGVDRRVEELHGPAGSYDDLKIEIPGELAAQLQAIVKSTHVTLNTLFQGAWGLLLARYARRSDVVFGAVTSGRDAPVPGIERMIGLLINTLPVRVQVDESQTLAEWLRQIQRTQAHLRQFAYVPHERIRGWSEVPPGQPLFESILVFENFRNAQVGEQLSSHMRGFENEQNINYPLTLVVMPREPIRLVLAYDRRRFSETSIERMGRDLIRLLQAVSESSDQQLARLQVTGAGDAVAVRGERRARPSGAILDDVYRHVSDNPGAIAVIGDEERGAWTYAGLVEAGENIAAELVARGLEPNSRVAVDLVRSNLFFASFLGVLRAGGVFVPLDQGWPEARKEYIIQDAACQYVIREDAQANSGLAEIDVTSALEETAGRGVGLPPVPRGGRPAYLIYTSGSTGAPKGVLLRHDSLHHTATELVRILQLDETTRVGQFSSPAFDGCIGDMSATLVAGATLCWFPAEAALSASTFRQAAQERGVTAMMLPPSYLSALDTQDLPELRTIVAVGEPLSRSVVSACQPGRALLNGYGPTEMTVGATLGVCDAADVLEPDLGVPVANTRIYLLDENSLRPVVPESQGEMYMSGPGVALGYWNQRALTAERFLPDLEAPGQRMYKSGDIGRLRQDGRLEFVGRVDQQVKIRGFRVEIGEVESAIRRVPGVKEAVVVAHSGHHARTMIAFVELHDDGPAAREVRLRLGGQLPEPMIPPRFEVVEEWPRTATGKIDRRELQRRIQAERANAAKTELEPSRSGTLGSLREIWGKVLNTSEIGDEDDFFEDSGGDSLSAVRMISLVEQKFGVELPVKSVFRRPTIRGLASLIDGASEGPSAGTATWKQDGSLDPAMRFSPVVSPAEPRQILLTGATGFVGRWVLKQLVERTKAEVRCLVRAPDIAGGTVRLLDALTDVGAAEDVLPDRVSVVLGDLGKEDLGLPQSDWKELSQNVDCIVHLGAWVHYLHPYERLREVNVEGTRTLLRLAGIGRPKRFIHGSTLGIFRGASASVNLGEFDPPPSDALEEAHRGYTLSKLVAEHLVWAACERGLSGTILRMGAVSGDRTTGRSNPSDLVFMTFAAALSIGLAPDRSFTINAVPVDYVADAVSHAATAARQVPRCLHLCHDSELDLEDLLSVASAEGFSMRRVPFDEWLETVSNHAAKDFGHLRALWTDSMGGPKNAQAFDRSIGRQIFDGTIGPPPAFDEEILQRYVRNAYDLGGRLEGEAKG